MPAYFSMTFELIVPEDDLLDYVEEKCSLQRKTEKMELLKAIVKEIWIRTSVLAIQTAWECSDIPPTARKVAGGIPPQTEPFCIIKTSSLNRKSVSSYEYMERGGVFIEDETKWCY